MSEQSSQPERLSKTSPRGAAAQTDASLHLVASEEDMRLVAALRAGDEAAFGWLFHQYHAALVRMALIYFSDQAVAEEIAQETWLAVFQGIRRFEGRASLKTWLFRILINQAKKRRAREGRRVPFSALWQPEIEPAEPAVEAERFWPPDAPRWAGGWVSLPGSWTNIPESRLLSQETMVFLLGVIEDLPPSQREVITLRDVEGWTTREVCALLEISEGHQRVLLHRARSKVRQALEQYFQQ
jgi:RNA polymerase sigma-70 factor (ECF subfamily)